MSLRLGPNILPNCSSDPPRPPYISAVSNKVIPFSIARSTTARVPSRSKRIPKLLHPSPTVETRSPDVPKFRYSIDFLLEDLKNISSES